MSELIGNKIAVACGLFAFALMLVGGVLSGSRLLTSLIRGGEGAVVFGLVVWLACRPLIDAKESPSASEPPEESKGENINQTV